MGQLVLVPGHTVHGGGFRADHRTDDANAHMRLHFYVYPDTKECAFAKGEHKNDYLPQSKNYANHEKLDVPEKGKMGNSISTLGNRFFHGYSV